MTAKLYPTAQKLNRALKYLQRTLAKLNLMICNRLDITFYFGVNLQS